MSEPLDDLRALLGAVEPSVGFERRTLRQIADVNASRAGGRRWMFLVPAGAAAIVIGIVSIRPVESIRPSGGVEVHSALRGPAIAPRGGLGNQAALPEIKSAPRTMPRARAVDAAWTIPAGAHADQAIAVHQLMTLIRAGKARVDGSVVATNDNGPIPELAPIELKPIVIAPLPSGQGGGSER